MGIKFCSPCFPNDWIFAYLEVSYSPSEEVRRAYKSFDLKLKLNDGQEFKIVKIFYQPDVLQKKLTEFGFRTEVRVTENYFIYANGIRYHSNLILK